MKVLLTGAHFTPAVAVIEELKNFKNIEIIYVGRKTTLEGDEAESAESQVLPKLKVKYLTIVTGRLRRSFDFLTIISLFKLPIGFVQALYIILKEKPDVVLSFGGYVAVPIVFMGWLWSIPIIIHEQTLVSGVANKVSALMADKIAVAFDKNDLAKKPNTIVTGSLIRDEVISPKAVLADDYKKIFQEARKNKLPVILITGGNQGAHVINRGVEGSLDDLLKIACVIHQTGNSKLKDYERLLSKQSDRYLVKKFIAGEMGTILSQVDLIVTRAGINTLTEASFLQKPVLAIPLPNLQNEQMRNAQYFQRLGLVTILPQPELNSQNLKSVITAMLKNLPALKIKAAKAGDGISVNAAKSLSLETIFLTVT